MHAVLHGVTRDQMMAKHQSNHIQVVYAPSAQAADRALAAKAAMAAAMGIKVTLCGEDADGTPLGARLAGPWSAALGSWALRGVLDWRPPEAATVAGVR